MTDKNKMPSIIDRKKRADGSIIIGRPLRVVPKQIDRDERREAMRGNY